jgi:HAD domain in Swiss Army Knife RNA repair proteins
MKPIIFLDIDGVLNGHRPTDNGYNTIEKDNVSAFNDILDNVDAEIVISSAWRYLVHNGSMTVRGFEQLLISHGVKCSQKVVDITRRDNDQCECSLQDRVDGIFEWIDENNLLSSFIVIDDLPLPLNYNFYQTNGNLGLTIEDAKSIRSIMEPLYKPVPQRIMPSSPAKINAEVKATIRELAEIQAKK